MTKVVQTTSRGQITIPKEIRDVLGNTYSIVSTGNSIILKPLNVEAKIDDIPLDDEGELTEAAIKKIESEWKAYKKGEYVELEDIAKEYGI
jgi:bifunctional DNA-binding transcriptional regulator/antitoxin component of YhaV-PrlF toxin-antitoxin module